MDEQLGLKAAVDDIRFQMLEQDKSMAVLRDIGKSNFGFSSILMTLITVLRLFFVPIAASWVPVFNGMLIMLAGLYGAMAFISIMVTVGSKWHPGLPRDYDELLEMFYGKTSEQVLLQQLSSYLWILDYNQPTLNKKHRLAHYSSWLLALIVLVVLFMGFIPKA